MISTSNYVARKFGVRSAMPGFIAKRLCPQLVFVECNYEKYKLASQQARAVVLEYNSNYVHEFGLDEFYVDITDAVLNRFQSSSPLTDASSTPSILELRRCAEELVAEMRQRITQHTGGLTCSAGIANNFFLAKVSADINKPDGQYSLSADREAIMSFLNELPCRKVGGIGKVSEKLLHDLDIKTVGEIMQRLPSLYYVLSPKFCDFLTRTCLGIGSEEVRSADATNMLPDAPEGQKRMSCERTFSPTADKKIAYSKLYDICHSLAPKIRSKKLRPFTVTLKVKTSTFDVLNRSVTKNRNSAAVDSPEELFEITKNMLDSLLPLKIRLLGVSVSNFVTSALSVGEVSIVSYFDTDKHRAGYSSDPPLRSGPMHESNTNPEWSCSSAEDFGSVQIEGRRGEVESALRCPVCEEVFAINLHELNQHVDDCLTKYALRNGQFVEVGGDLSISCRDGNDNTTCITGSNTCSSRFSTSSSSRTNSGTANKTATLNSYFSAMNKK